MLRSTQEMKNYAIGATDGEIGHVCDFFFDDKSWVIRYLVVETGSWLMSRKVLISPFALQEADWQHKRLPVCITMNQVKHSPDIDTQKPVSRQHEMAYADYYGYPYYWGGNGLWGEGLYAPLHASRKDVGCIPPNNSIATPQHAGNDAHLRSCQSLIGYHIHASDSNIGHLQEMLVDETTWSIRYMVVDTSTYWIGHEVLVSPDWVKRIDWDESRITVDLLQQTVKDSPRFESSAALNRQQEADLHKHYKRSTYWEKEQRHDELTAAQD